MLEDDDVRFLAQAGATAPSGGNAQPWRLLATERWLEASLDPARSGSFLDVDRTASLLALGAFVESIGVAGRSRGLEPNVEPVEETLAVDPRVRITFEKRDSTDAPFFAALRARTTNRRPWNGETIDRAAIERVAAAARADGVHRLVAASGTQRTEVAEALAEADVVRTFNRAYMDEMLSEFRWTVEDAQTTRDGLDLETLELTAGDRRGLQLMRKRWFLNLFVTRNRIRSMNREALCESSHLAALVMPRGADPTQLLAAGRAMQRTWLEATEAGLAIQPWCTIPFFQLRVERDPASLPARDRRAIQEITDALRRIWEVGDEERVVFPFRISIPDAPPSALALRRDWTGFTTLDRS